MARLSNDLKFLLLGATLTPSLSRKARKGEENIGQKH